MMAAAPLTPATLFLALFSIGLGVAGQMLMKQGMLAHPNLTFQLKALLGALMNTYVLLGFVCYGLASVSWLVVLSRLPLSIAYPMLSLGYVAVTVLSWHFFGEPLTPTKLVAVGFILVGIVVLSRG